MTADSDSPDRVIVEEVVDGDAFEEGRDEEDKAGGVGSDRTDVKGPLLHL